MSVAKPVSCALAVLLLTTLPAAASDPNERAVGIGKKPTKDLAAPVLWGTPGGGVAIGPPAGLKSVIGTDDRVQITPTLTIPWRLNAHLVVTFPLGTDGCTGFLVGPYILATAGHCVYLSSLGGWATDIQVIPGRDGTGGASEPFGRYAALAAFAPTGWVNSALPEYDFGAILLSVPVGDSLGWYPLKVFSTTEILSFFSANIAGYPGDKPLGTQWYGVDFITAVGDNIVSYETDTFGGQSGAAAYVILNTGRYPFAIHTGSVSHPSCNPGDNCGTRMRQDVVDFFVNLGAPIFSDGFESGDVSAWSSSVP